MENQELQKEKIPPKEEIFSPEQKWNILREALLGGKCLSQILTENNISEKEFFTWRAEAIRKFKAMN